MFVDNKKLKATKVCFDNYFIQGWKRNYESSHVIVTDNGATR